ncbi:MAG: succinate dehydrogenase, hydrophobic membrane anchor protein [Pseudomonadota bacterium]
MFKQLSPVQHWKHQRRSAVALIPLTTWLLISISSLAGADYKSVSMWIASPMTIALLGLFLIVSTYHAVLGIEVVLEDYLQPPFRHTLFGIIRITLLIAVLLSLFAIIKITMGRF